MAGVVGKSANRVLLPLILDSISGKSESGLSGRWVF